MLSGLRRFFRHYRIEWCELISILAPARAARSFVDKENILGNLRNIAFWVVLFLLILALFNMFSGGSTSMSSARSLSYSEFLQRVDAGEVASVTLDGERAMAQAKSGESFVTIVPGAVDITQ